MAVITLLSDIARVSEEQEVIYRILMTCQALFAPYKVRYLIIRPEGPDQMISISPEADDENYKTKLISVIGNEFEFTQDGKGFIIPILYQHETVGVLGVYEVSIPERIREYLNLNLSFARFVGLAIKNARSWHEIKNIQKALEERNHELGEKTKNCLLYKKNFRELIKILSKVRKNFRRANNLSKA